MFLGQYFSRAGLSNIFGRVVKLFLISQIVFSCANLERVSTSKDNKILGSSENQELAYVYKSDQKDNQAKSQNVKSKKLNPAIVSLMDQAAAQESAGQIELSASTIERALRISPQTPQLHLSLARLRLKQNQAHNALQLALKGQSLLSASDKVLAKDFWEIIGDSYTRLGDSARASQAYSHL